MYKQLYVLLHDIETIFLHLSCEILKKDIVEAGYDPMIGEDITFTPGELSFNLMKAYERVVNS